MTLVEHEVTYLEMTDRREHHRAAELPALSLRQVGSDSVEWLSTARRVGAAHHWPVDQQPTDGARTYWIVDIGGEVAGVIAVEPQPAGDVEIVTFGLVAEMIGRGAGAAALSLAIDLAWNQPPADDQPVRRIWLHTSTLDHPHALPNYQRRGLRPYRTEIKTEKVPPR